MLPAPCSLSVALTSPEVQMEDMTDKTSIKETDSVSSVQSIFTVDHT